MLDINHYSSEWSTKPLSIPELVRIGLEETNVDFLGTLVGRLDNILQTTPKIISKNGGEFENPSYSLVSRNRHLVENIRYWRTCELQNLPLPRETFNHEIQGELERQRKALEPKLKKAQEKEQRLARIVHLKEELANLEPQITELISQKNDKSAELAVLEKGRQL